MQTFIVLGIIPGTNIQINFYAWFILVALVAIGSIVILANHVHELQKLSAAVMARNPMPATKFHTRLQ